MWFNPLIKSILQSPLHPLLSGNTMLVAYTGRRSGIPYETPVNYVELGGRFLTTSLRKRTWWRNLLNGQTCTVLLRGKPLLVQPRVTLDEAALAPAFTDYFRACPNVARYFKVVLENGEPQSASIASVCQSYVLIDFMLIQA